MSDIVERLRATTDGATVNPDGLEAADTITTLRAEIERLESVMEPWRNLAKLLEGDVATLRATNERLRKIVEETAPHRLREVDYAN